MTDVIILSFLLLERMYNLLNSDGMEGCEMMKALYITPGDTPDKAFGSSPVTDAVRENAITIHIPFLSLFFFLWNGYK